MDPILIIIILLLIIIFREVLYFILFFILMILGLILVNTAAIFMALIEPIVSFFANRSVNKKIRKLRDGK